MFYSQIILAKKGPLGKLWMAAHFHDRKLTRAQIFATDISTSVDSIVTPAVPLALRVSGHLLLGVVRIYSKKVHFLWQDCHQAMVQIQMAFLQQPSDKSGIDMDKDGKGGKNNTSMTRRKRRTRGSHPAADDEEPEDDDEVLATIPATTAMEGFGIPFDLNDDTINNAEDWVPAELNPQDQDDDNDDDTRSKDGAAALGLSMDASPQQKRRVLARAAADQTLHSMDDTATMEGRSLATEEQWTAFDPDDGEEEEDDEGAPMLPPDDDEDGPMLPPDDHSSLQAEIPRANESVTSETATGRPSALLDPANMGRARMSEAEFSVPNDVSGIPIMDDDDEGPGSAGRASSVHLDSAMKPHDESSAAAVSLGGGSSPEDNKKRKSETKKGRRRKRRKVQSNQGEIELSSAQIRANLTDTSDLVVRPLPIGVETPEFVPDELQGLVPTNVDPELLEYLGFDKIFLRPALADDGNAAPELIELWTQVAQLRDEAREHARRAVQGDGQEEDSVEDVEVARRQQQQDEGSDGPGIPHDEDAAMLPPDDDERYEDEEAPMLPPDDDEEPPAPGLDDEDEESRDKRKSSLSLGLVADEMGWDEEEEEEHDDRQAANSDELVGSNSKWHKHTVKVFSLLKSRMAPPGSEEAQDKESHLSYNGLVDGCSRRTAVGVFFELLQLKTWDYIGVDQDQSYGDILVSPGVKFAEPVPK